MMLIVKRFIRDERGAISPVLQVGVIILPLIVFLAIFGADIIEYFNSGEETMIDEGDALRDAATGD